ncbi:hypothetical protein FTUN_7645 [Frigoriglobus tundricola]|uniref:Uncharacterized protein n=1 Tax=Frigoriglobus tundricola TaxID=2774151 RepID=A0A6M5Z488_9BACT|nr:hypothetical protein FTUN_7645 [Frigoriglobus tundricola]
MAEFDPDLTAARDRLLPFFSSHGCYRGSRLSVARTDHIVK